MHVLVTGGAGFIGSNFVRHLLGDTEHEVTTLDALTYAGSLSNLDSVLDHPRHEFVEGDVRSRSDVEEVMADADAVVHFAAESHVDRSIKDADDFVSTNVGGTQLLLSMVKDTEIQRFVHVSTDEVYGEALEGEFTETDCLAPQNPYAAAKAGADHLAASYEHTHDVPVSIIRPSNNFGPRQHPEKLIPKFVNLATENEPLPLYGDGRQVREWTYVTDTCRAIHRVLETGAAGEAYNVGSGERVENRRVAERICDVVGAPRDLITYVEDRPGHDERYALNTEKVEALGWEPEWSFDDALEETVEFYLED